MKSFTPGQAVEIRLPRGKEWIAATYSRPTERNGVSGWHRIGGGLGLVVPDARIRKIATREAPMTTLLSIALIILTPLAMLSAAVAVLYSVLAIVRWLRGYLDARRVWREQRRRRERLGLVVGRATRRAWR